MRMGGGRTWLKGGPFSNGSRGVGDKETTYLILPVAAAIMGDS